jgi:hypothetical protein
MNQFEKRQLPRLPVVDVPRGALTLIHGGRRIVMLDLRDISDTGISFSLNEQMQVLEKISVEYADAKVKIEVFGRVAWCNETQTLDLKIPFIGKYLLGVELLSPLMLYAHTLRVSAFKGLR